jgi:hypothetical protein
MEQLKQAHRDRTLQLPRREYSEIAIESRKSLIDEAYTLLSDAAQRQSYDTQFLTRSYPLDTLEALTPGSREGMSDIHPQVGEEALRSLATDAPLAPPAPTTPTIEIDDTQLVGVLLVLLELGEYELVIRLGRPYVVRGSGSLADGRYGDPKRVRDDIVLTLALACLELGREQWQQNHYENAAESLETGQELLLQENLFPALRGELQSDLYKLRPYRILELVARPMEETAARRQGIKLLKGMLHDRGGIDGTGDDLSGLTTDDFLRFIQQLRGYLTAGEQQEIFEAEARRPSAVATYLAVYALLARGFAFHQPALVRRAKQLLQRVATRQDVHLEHAVCSLLLGQAEEAGRALELSQEYEPLAFIREHSHGSPDLLPGLCLYAERWLREEVFTHFRDLTNQQTALKEYFADPQVQAFLETMTDTGVALADTPTISPESSTSTWATATPFVQQPTPVSLETDFAAAYSVATPETPVSTNGQYPDNTRQVESPRASDRLEPETPLSVAERVSQLSPEGQLQSRSAPAKPGSRPQQNGNRPSMAVTPPPPKTRSRSPHWGRLASVSAAGVCIFGLLGFATVRALGWMAGQVNGPQVDQPALDISLTEPVVPIPSPPTPETQIGVKDVAAKTINDWLAVKQKALGETHDTSGLNTILVDPVLREYQNLVASAQQENWYFTYEHTLEVTNVEPDDPAADELLVQAEVKEIAKNYDLGLEDPGDSYDKTLSMQYTLIRQDGKWFIKDMNKLN